MIGKLIGALVGGKMAENTRAIGGPTGALLGAAVPVVLRRMSIPAMIALGVGGYAVKKYMDKDEGSSRSTRSGSGKSGSSKARSSSSTRSTNDNNAKKNSANSAKNKNNKAETAAA